MTYQEALDRVEELRGHGNAPFSVEQKRLIAQMYPEIMGKPFRKTACQRCYHDAVIEMALKLRKEQKMREKCDYHMRAGFIIRCGDFDNGEIYTNANLTNDVAKRYLERFPQKRAMFDRIPEETAETPAEAVKEPTKQVVKPSGEKAVKTPAKRKKRK
jgi:hypothetical protein